MSNDIRLYFKNTPRSSAIKINETINGTPPKKRKSDLTKVSLPEGLIDDCTFKINCYHYPFIHQKVVIVPAIFFV